MDKIEAPQPTPEEILKKLVPALFLEDDQPGQWTKLVPIISIFIDLIVLILLFVLILKK